MELPRLQLGVQLLGLWDPGLRAGVAGCLEADGSLTVIGSR